MGPRIVYTLIEEEMGSFSRKLQAEIEQEFINFAVYDYRFIDGIGLCSHKKYEFLLHKNVVHNFNSFSYEFKKRTSQFYVYLQACKNFDNRECVNIIFSFFSNLFVIHDEMQLKVIPENLWLKEYFPGFWSKEEKMLECRRNEIVSEICHS